MALEAECVELRKQHVQSLPIHVDDADSAALDLPKELLEGKAEIQQMLESKAFKEFAQMYQAHARPKVHENGGGDNRDAPDPGGGAVPVPMDDEFDEAFQDADAAEVFWEKHKGDKRAILDALVSAKIKRLRKSPL